MTSEPSDVERSTDVPEPAAGPPAEPKARRPFGPAAVFLVWLGFLVCVVYFAGALVNVQPPWREATSNWDTGWYLTIINDGYQMPASAETNLAFFPLYPLIVGAIAELGVDPIAAGVAISLACFLGALFLLRKLLAEKLSEEIARHTLLLLVFWPFSFFFGLVYTESLFLLLVVGAFFFAHRERWWLAGLCAAGAGATRAVGVFVAVAVVLTYFDRVWKPTLESTAKLVAVGSVGVSGLVAFMIYLESHTGNFLAFLEAQKFWPNRMNGVVGLRSIPTTLETKPAASWDFALIVIYLIPMIVFLALGIYVFARVDPVWGGFCLLVLLAPVPTGSIASTNRYVLALFPCFVAAAKILGERAAVVAAGSAGLLGLFAYHYVYHPQTFLG